LRRPRHATKGLAVVRAWYKDYFSEQFRGLPGSVEAYLAATVLVVIASLIRWGLGFLGETLLPFTTYYPVVLFATYLGGPWVGIFTAIAGGLVGWWAFLSPHVGFFPLRIAGELELPTYAVACALIIWGADSYRRLAARLREEERLRTLAVEELAHRLKNKIASIQSIISYQLREQPRLRDDIIARLEAEWRPLHDEARDLSNARNILAHHPAKRIGTSKNGMAFDIYSIHIEPYEHVGDVLFAIL
jgi:hypothetical protein